MKKVVFIVLIIASVASYLYYSKNSDTKEDGIITLYGNVQIRQIDIGFQVSGIINQMSFEEGQSVKKGELLASIEESDFEQNYQISLSQIAQAQAKLNEATSLLETNIPLCAKGAVAKRTCISYQNAKDEALALLQSAESTSIFQKNQLNHTKIYAPEDAIVATRIKEVGSVIQATSPIYTLVKLSPMFVRAYIPQTQLGNVVNGTKARVIIDTIDLKTGLKKEYKGRVGYVSSVAEFTPKTVQTEELRSDLVYRVNIYIDEFDEALKQGMPTTIKIDLR